MGSRKEEERNEKIIRGLMKLPPNRRCINCNSLGPQYVCTNFWTFVCMTCSGIHREFTHRVKSVSMSKFTSEEVEALQNGGNQRAREIYLKDWDQQRQRLPDNSNVEKVRDFIKTVYVDRRYTGGKNSDKPPRDLQRLRSHEDETRRASSYHSYSQSPPYDFQYEDRRLGKQGAMLTRKPGSDRGLYVGKMSNFICSPTRLSDRVAEDRFANEGSVSRFSDYSVSSGGDPARSGTESPGFQKETGFGSPPIHPSRGSSGVTGMHLTTDLFSESSFKRDPAGITRPQRATSLGSSGSFGSLSKSLSNNLGSSVDVVSEPEQVAGALPDKNLTFPNSAAGYGGFDLFEAPVVQESGFSSASAVEMFQLSSASSAPIDLFQVAPLDPTQSVSLFEPSQTSLHSSVDLFGITQNQSVSTVDKASAEFVIPKNEGWATFDNVQPAPSMPETQNLPQSLTSTVGSSGTFDQISYSSTMQWPQYQNPIPQISSAAPNAWDDDFHNVPAPGNTSDMWNAFDSSVTNLPVEGIEQSVEQQLTAYKSSSIGDPDTSIIVSEDSVKDGIQTAASYGEFAGHGGPSNILFGPSFTPPHHSPMLEMQSHSSDHRSTNPFDIPFDSKVEHGNFFDMTSLQTALPNLQSPSTFLAAASPSWFSQDPITPFIPVAPQGGLAYMAGQATSTQLANAQTQGPVASIGGNPFA